MNDVIKKRKGKDGYPNYFITKDNITSNHMTLIANQFNVFLLLLVVLVLAGEVAHTGKISKVESKVLHVKESRFLKGTDKKEIIDTVKNLKSNKSTDCNDIDVWLVKDIIECSETSHIFPSVSKKLCFSKQNENC